MNRGVALYWEPFSEAEWEAAVLGGDWPALYARLGLTSLDWPRDRGQTLGDVARLAYARRCGTRMRPRGCTVRAAERRAILDFCNQCAIGPRPFAGRYWPCRLRKLWAYDTP